MRGTWVLGIMAFLAVVTIGARWSGYPAVAEEFQKTEPKPKQKPGTGFSDQEKLKVQILQEFIVTALEDLEPTRGSIETLVDENGKKFRYMSSGKFGMGRVSTPYSVEHGSERIIGSLDGYEYDLLRRMDEEGKRPEWLKENVRLNLKFDVPHLVVSASGKPLAEDNVEIVWRRHDETFDVDPEIMAAVRKNLAAANLGEEFAFDVPGYKGWAKPLKLSKQECLSCHPGMKVGDTVGISTYFSATDTKAKPEVP
jgi:hypothetical protein